MVEGYRRLVGASPLEPPASALSPSKKGSVPAQNMLFGFIAGILTVMAVASLCCLFMKEVLPFLKQRRTLKVKGKKESKSFKYDKISLRRFELEEIERATNNLSQECLLGSGGFGNVYKGNFDLEGTLAIKIAHSEPFLSVEEFRNEVRLLSTMKHRNLVGLVGYCEEPEGDGAKILVYEYVPNGSMLEYMMGNRGKSLTWKQRVKIAIGAARGIAYLHEEVKPSIIHRDIKPNNILIGEGYEAKVSDFGLVKSGPTGDQSHAWPSLENGNVEEIIDANLLCEPCNMKVMLKMGQLALRCVAQGPKHRPTMTQVCQELEQALYSVEGSINKQPSKGFLRSISSSQQPADSEAEGSVEKYDRSHSFVSIDGVGFQKFYVDMDSFSIQSSNLMCLENNSISIDINNNNLRRIQGDDTI